MTRACVVRCSVTFAAVKRVVPGEAGPSRPAASSAAGQQDLIRQVLVDRARRTP